MLRFISHPHTLEERLAEQKARLGQRAHQLKPGPERDELLKKVGQIDTATHVNEWLIAESEAKRPPIPTEVGHPFRSKPATL